MKLYITMEVTKDKKEKSRGINESFNLVKVIISFMFCILASQPLVSGQEKSILMKHNVLCKAYRQIEDISEEGLYAGSSYFRG